MKKIGRNDECPCGSGKKFKRCHLGREGELLLDETEEILPEISAKITNLPCVQYGRSKEMVDSLDIKELTGSEIGIKFIDLKKYGDLNLFGQGQALEREGGSGAVVVNILKTQKTDPDNIYVAISQKIEDGTLVHQLAHALNYLGGSKLIPGMAKPLSFDLEIPVGYWLDYLRKEFGVTLDADDTIIFYLYENGMLIKNGEIEGENRPALKSKSDQILKFLAERSAEIDALICERPGYIGSREGVTTQ